MKKKVKAKKKVSSTSLSKAKSTKKGKTLVSKNKERGDVFTMANLLRNGGLLGKVRESVLIEPKPQDASYWTGRSVEDEERDWGYKKETWLDDYWASRKHEHRMEVIKALIPFELKSLGEVGCNVGPNLDVVHEHFPQATLWGIDVSEDAIERAKINTGATVQVGDACRLPWDSQSIDVLLYDAVLMYVPFPEIEKAMDEIERVALKGAILVERYADTKEGAVKGHVWARDYKALLEDRGFTVEEIKVTKKTWPTSTSWQEHGRIYIARH